MTHGAPEMGQGERTLSRAAGLVAEARQDLDALSRALADRLAGLRGQWAGSGGTAFLALHEAWTERQAVVTRALDGFGAALLSTERDNTATDQAQAAAYHRFTGRLG